MSDYAAVSLDACLTQRHAFAEYLERHKEPFAGDLRALRICHTASALSGWHHDLATGTFKVPNVPTKLMLAVSELAEGMEAHRKNQKDDHLPEHDGLAVELADCIIRCADLAYALGYPIHEIITQKVLYNLQRADHRPENRTANEGKMY